MARRLVLGHSEAGSRGQGAGKEEHAALWQMADGRNCKRDVRSEEGEGRSEK